MPRVSLLGVPHDENSAHLRGAADAPAVIRRVLTSDAYSSWTETGFDMSQTWADRGDVVFDPQSDPWACIESAVAEALDEQAPLICMGGDHAVTHPILRAVRARNPSLTIVHIDAHPDIYDAYQGNRRSHASPFARIMEEGLADRLIQLGLRTICGEHREQFHRFGVEAYDMAACASLPDLDIRTPIYVSLDMDALDPAFAPGVSHREPGGFSTRDVIRILHGLRQPLVAADVVELNPTCDVGGVTAIVATKLVRELAGVMLRNAAAAQG
jgi:agmatinase